MHSKQISTCQAFVEFVCLELTFFDKIAEKKLGKDSEILKNIAKGLRKRTNNIYTFNASDKKCLINFREKTTMLS